MVYFKGGSALASMQNLINHNKIMKAECKFTTLDNYVFNNKCTVDFLKCDVEGAELFVLIGGKKTIQNYKPFIFIEIYEEWCKKCGYNAIDIVNFLQELGYGIFQAKNRTLVKCNHLEFSNSERYNYFFLHHKKHKEIIEKG